MDFHMHRLKRFTLGAILAGACSLTAAATPANGLDAAARARLVGEHLLTLQWLSQGDLADAGKLVVKDSGDTLSVDGQQLGQGDNAGDYLRVSGRIVSASRDGFVFEGDIVVRVHYIADAVECKRSGRFTFKTKGGRKYWRMQEMTNPCDEVADYVDVYFRGI
jgi:hypothetical protein